MHVAVQKVKKKGIFRFHIKKSRLAAVFFKS